MATLIADQGMTWLCKCGERPLRHHEHCDRCGEARPEPPPEAEGELSDIGRPDAALQLGDIVTFGADDRQWVITLIISRSGDD